MPSTTTSKARIISRALSEISRLEGLHPHLRIHGVAPARWPIELGLADVGGDVEHLALQVGEVDGVVVDDTEGADAGRGEIERRRRAESAGADHAAPAPP